jgi:hypothetical protein
VIIAKGEYPSELNIPLPFSLVNNNVHKNRLEVMPAYFWIHNLYALERNSWKTKNRDKRKIKIQRIESDYLAPDTAEEIITALSLLDGWLGEAGFSPMDMTGAEETTVRNIMCRHFERSKRGQVIIKPLEAIASYRQMLRYYAVKTVAAFFDSQPSLDYKNLCGLLGSPAPKERIKDWENFGGQIVPAFRVDKLREEIGKDKYKNWDEIHSVYDLWDKEYPLDKCRHAWSALALLHETDKAPDAAGFRRELAAVVDIRRWIDRQIFESREKDYHNQFKKATFRNQEEMEQILGKPCGNPFIRLIHKESGCFYEMIERISARISD